ncbi:hypothetical protein ADL26_11485, partial [Thermoactinomyces vulgaris]
MVQGGPGFAFALGPGGRGDGERVELEDDRRGRGGARGPGRRDEQGRDGFGGGLGDGFAPGGEDQLAERLGLGGGAEVDLVELGDAVDHDGDLVAEVAAEGFEGVAGVLDGVVEEPGRDRGGVDAEFGEDGGDGDRVGDVGL